MAVTIKYTILLVVAIIAVSATAVPPPTNLTTPTTPTTPVEPITPDKESKPCTAPNDTNFVVINDRLAKFRTCLKDLLNNGSSEEEASLHPRVCSTIADALALKAPVLDAVTACGKSKNDTDVALDVLISMMNISLVNKDILTPERVKCINDSKEELKECVKHKIPGLNNITDELGSTDLLTKEIMVLNFQAAALKKAQDLQECVNKVWKTDARCTEMSKITDQLFAELMAKIPSSSEPSAAFNIVPGSVLLVASMLLLL